MRVRSLNLIHARIPLKRTIRHASHSRRSNETLIVRCELENGCLGWGEGLPRSYVTGETIDDAWELGDRIDLDSIRTEISADSIWAALNGISLGEAAGPRGCFGSSLRCAVELALLDACARGVELPLWKLVQSEVGLSAPPSERVQYVGVVTTSKPWKAMLVGSLIRAHGFQQCKVKVGHENDATIMGWARRGLGQRMKVRVDANEAWTADEAIRSIERLREFDIASVEQPVAHEHVHQLKSLRSQTDVPIMLDESLCSVLDAQQAISAGYCDLFNIRVSKCGGIGTSLKLIEMAREAGIGYQLGCLVGETSILSAAGRHLAVCLPDAVAVEGSYDRYLVRHSLSDKDLTFGRGGWADRLDGPGLGISVDETQVRRVSEREKKLL